MGRLTNETVGCVSRSPFSVDFTYDVVPLRRTDEHFPRSSGLPDGMAAPVID
jgi:hypothetical protein